MTRLLTSLGRLLILRNLIVLIGLIALIAVVWLLGPHLKIEGSHPLAPLEMRALVTALLIGVPLLVSGIRYWRARQARRRAIRDLSRAGQLTPLADNSAAAESEELRDRFEAALAALREASYEGARTRDLAYEIPCYVLIGAAGSGKTTLLRNAGLRAPPASRTAADAAGAFGGPQSCKLWVTDEAIVFDLAGDFAQGAGQDPGRAGWQSLLELLEEYRPRRPLNGVILTLSAESLMTEGAEARHARALHLKRGLQEMLRSLGVRLPVYLVVTKADLISGFAEYFDLLPIEARRQIWGMPLAADFDLGRAGAAGALEAGLHDLLERVSARRTEALRNEHDLSRCERIFGFPEQLANLFPMLCEVTAEVFRPGRHEVKPQLRGVFLTSGTQTDWALDRAFAREAEPMALSPARKVPTSGRSGPFFINRLLADLILAESGLAGTDPRLERRTARWNAVGWAAAITIVVLMSAVWSYAAQVNRNRLQGSHADAEQLLAAERSLASGAGLAAALPVLDQAAMLADRYRDEDDIVFVAQGAGLSASPEVAPHAQAMYARVLFAELMPRLMAELETRLRSASAGGAQDALRQDLEVYLMMGEPDRFRRQPVTEWFTSDWAGQYAFQPGVRDGLETHLGALMAMMPQAQTLDDQLVASARAALVQVPAAQQVYATLRRDAAADPGLAPFSLADALGPRAVLSLTATGTAGLRAEIPGFYTRSGFQTYLLGRLPLLLGDLVQTDWVMGPAAAASNSKVSGLADQVAKLYAADYVARWQKLVDSLRLRPLADLQSALQALDNLSGVDSPLTRLIAAIRAHTDLEPPGSSQAQGTVAAAEGAAKGPTSQSAGTLVASLTGAAKSASAALLFTTWPGDAIRSPFAPLIALGSTSSGSEPIGQVRALLAGAAGLLQSVASAPSPAAAAYNLALAEAAGGPGNAITALRTQAPTYPPVIARILDAAASDASAVLNGLAGSHIAAAWRDAGGGQCQTQIAGRFPIERSATSEIALDDFKSFFGPGGVMDIFQKTYLQSFASSGQAGAGSRGQAVVAPATLQAFQQAARIRAAFFNGGQLQVSYSLTPTFLDPRALQVTLQIGSDQLVYRHEPPRQQPMVWPSAASGVTYTLIDLSKQPHSQTLAGTWALFRMVDQAGKVDSSDQSAVDVSLSVDKLTAAYQLDTNSLASAFDPTVVQGFQCPGMG